MRFAPLEKGACQESWVRALRTGRVSFGYTENDCWMWLGATTMDGYGRIRAGGNSIRAHRVTFTALYGPIPEGLTLDHVCGNRPCVRPDHLEPVTNKENILRGEGIASRNADKTHCPEGHALTDDNLRPADLARGFRSCLTCHRRRDRERMQRKAATR